MYGLVNKAVRQMVIEGHGEETWHRIRTLAGVSQDHFVSLDPYPDEITYNLVGAACKTLGAEPAQLLKAFGEYWVEFAWTGEYRHMLSASGKTFATFVGNLDQLHSRLHATFREFQPPSFRVEKLEESQLTLHYYSHRAGLLPFVGGLLEGVGRRLGVQVSVEFLPRPQGADHESMIVSWTPLESTPTNA
jgi:hypothetical protein